MNWPLSELQALLSDPQARVYEPEAEPEAGPEGRAYAPEGYLGQNQKLFLKDYTNLTGSVTANMLLTLSAMGKKGSVDIRANPKIVTLDGESALVEITNDQYMPIGDNVDLASTDVKMISFGISLTVLPKITRDNEILLKVEPMVSNQSNTTNSNGLPLVNTRRPQTTVKLRSDETFILGGLVQEVEQRNTKNLSISSESTKKINT